jgi:hypothetical protein
VDIEDYLQLARTMLKATVDLHPKGRWLTSDDPVIAKPKGVCNVSVAHPINTTLDTLASDTL